MSNTPNNNPNTNNPNTYGYKKDLTDTLAEFVESELDTVLDADSTTDLDLEAELNNDESETEVETETEVDQELDQELDQNNKEPTKKQSDTTRDLSNLVTSDTEAAEIEIKIKKPLLTDIQQSLLTKYKESISSLVLEPDEVKRRYLRNLIQYTYSQQLGFTAREIEADIRDIASGQTTTVEQKIRFSLEEILAAADNDSSWLIPRLLFSVGLYLIAGAPKTFKSMLMYEIAYAVAISGSFLGEPAKKGKVLIYQCEEPKVTIADRLLTRGFGDSEEAYDNAVENESITIIKGFNLKTGLSSLQEEIDRLKPDLILFDSLRAITSSIETSENSAEFSKYLYALQKVIANNEICSVVIHHANKTEQPGRAKLKQVAGSLALTGAVDGIILLEAMDREGFEPPKIKLTTIPRNTADIQLILSFRRREGGRWFFQKEEEVGLDEDMFLVQQQILRYLAQLDEPITKYALCMDLGIPVNDGEADNALCRLTDSSLIKASFDRSDKKFRYSLPKSSPWLEHFNKELEDDTELSSLIGGESINNLSDKFLSTDSKLANQIAGCTSKKEMNALLDSLNKDQKIKVWKLLTLNERNRVQKIINPPMFAEDYFFTFKGKKLSIVSIERNYEKRTYDYTFDDGSVFTEEELSNLVYASPENTKFSDKSSEDSTTSLSVDNALLEDVSGSSSSNPKYKESSINKELDTVNLNLDLSSLNVVNSSTVSNELLPELEPELEPESNLDQYSDTYEIDEDEVIFEPQNQKEIEPEMLF